MVGSIIAASKGVTIENVPPGVAMASGNPISPKQRSSNSKYSSTFVTLTVSVSDCEHPKFVAVCVTVYVVPSTGETIIQLLEIIVAPSSKSIIEKRPGAPAVIGAGLSVS